VEGDYLVEVYVGTFFRVDGWCTYITIYGSATSMAAHEFACLDMLSWSSTIFHAA